MFVPFLVLRNAFRHKLRTALTMVGIVVAILAFGLLRTIVDAWYAGAEPPRRRASSRATRSRSCSRCPLNYAQKIRQVRGVTSVAAANWFGGVYITESNFFPQFAIDPGPYLAMYPEYLLSERSARHSPSTARARWRAASSPSATAGRSATRSRCAARSIPGTWTFTLRGIYEGADAKIDESQFFFHWALLNERIKQLYPRRADTVGVYVVEIGEPGQAAEISERIDATFKNSLAETLTETEKAFQLGFVAMTEAILVAVQAVSFVIIVIIMAVMANTMAMTARERYSEYATMKALGFSNGFVALLIFAESIGIALVGGVLGIALTFPLVEAFGSALGRAVPDLQPLGADDPDADGLRAGRRRDRGADPGVARRARAHRRWLAGGGVTRPGRASRSPTSRAICSRASSPRCSPPAAWRSWCTCSPRCSCSPRACRRRSWPRAARQRARDPQGLADGGAKRHRSPVRVDRGDAARHRHRRGRRQARLQGAGGADQPSQARRREARPTW